MRPAVALRASCFYARTMALECCSCCLRLVLVLLLLGSCSPSGAAPLCSSSPPSVDSVQGLARRSSVVIEGKVLAAHSVAQPAAARGGGESETTSQPPLLLLLLPPPLLVLPEQPTSTATTSLLGPPSSPPSPSSPAEPLSWVARVLVHQVWPRKSGGLQKDALLWVLLPAQGSACGRRLREESRYIFFMEPVATFSSNASSTSTSSGSPSHPPPPLLFRASSPPLETDRSLKKEVGRALCTRGCGK